MPGPPPKPTKLKELEGNPGKRALNVNEPQPSALFTLPLPPDVLGDVGRSVWTDFGQELLKSGLLTYADLPVFLGFCINYEVMIQAAEAIKDKGMLVHGARGKVRNPAIAALTSASSAVKAFGVEFGMTPSARSRIKLPGDLSDPLGFLDDGSEEDFGSGV